jgi:hypothetical protein
MACSSEHRNTVGIKGFALMRMWHGWVFISRTSERLGNRSRGIASTHQKYRSPMFVHPIRIRWILQPALLLLAQRYSRYRPNTMHCNWARGVKSGWDWVSALKARAWFAAFAPPSLPFPPQRRATPRHDETVRGDETRWKNGETLETRQDGIRRDERV